jgi:hypothetical protein
VPRTFSREGLLKIKERSTSFIFSEVLLEFTHAHLAKIQRIFEKKQEEEFVGLRCPACPPE